MKDYIGFLIEPSYIKEETRKEDILSVPHSYVFSTFFGILSRAFSSLLHQLTGKNRKIRGAAHTAENGSIEVLLVLLKSNDF